MIAYWLGIRQGWFRLFGWGICWADRSIHPALFSERMGLVRVLRVGIWSFRLLKPRDY